MSFQIVLRSNDTCSCCCRRNTFCALLMLPLQHTVAYLQSRIRVTRDTSDKVGWLQPRMRFCR